MPIVYVGLFCGSCGRFNLLSEHELNIPDKVGSHVSAPDDYKCKFCNYSARYLDDMIAHCSTPDGNDPRYPHRITKKHAYWGFRCKTKTCGIAMLAHYIGEHDGRPIYPLPSEMPGWFEYECGACHKAHTYTRKEMELFLLDSDLRTKFVPWF